MTFLITASPSQLSGQSSITNVVRHPPRRRPVVRTTADPTGAAAATATVTATNIHRTTTNGYTKIQQGIFVFQISQPEKIVIRRLQDLYDSYHPTVPIPSYAEVVPVPAPTTVATAASKFIGVGTTTSTGLLLLGQSNHVTSDRTNEPGLGPSAQEGNVNRTMGAVGSTDYASSVFRHDELVSVDMIIITRRTIPSSSRNNALLADTVHTSNVNNSMVLVGSSDNNNEHSNSNITKELIDGTSHEQPEDYDEYDEEGNEVDEFYDDDDDLDEDYDDDEGYDYYDEEGIEQRYSAFSLTSNPSTVLSNNDGESTASTNTTKRDDPSGKSTTKDDPNDDTTMFVLPYVDSENQSANFGTSTNVGVQSNDDNVSGKIISPMSSSAVSFCDDDDEVVITTTFARLSDHSGWIPIEVNGIDYVEQVLVETGLYVFYVDNINEGGIIPRRHPMDDTSIPLSTENCLQDIPLIPSMTKLYCDYKVVHPITGVSFYRIQQMNASYLPLWVHPIQYSAEPKRTPNIYKLVPENKVRTGQLFAYRAIQGTLLRMNPDCTEASKIHNTNAIINPNDVVIGDLVRESPVPEFGNGPFVRLVSSIASSSLEPSHYGWLFEKKLHEIILQPIPIHVGYWEFQLVESHLSTIDESTTRSNDTGCQAPSVLWVYQQPLGRCLLNDKPVAKLRVGDIIQCDRKISVMDVVADPTEIHYDEQTTVGAEISNYTIYRVIINDDISGWIIDRPHNPSVYHYPNINKNKISHINNSLPPKLQLLSAHELNMTEDDITKHPSPDTVDTNAVGDITVENDDDDEDEAWSPMFVREMAAVCGSTHGRRQHRTIVELEYQRVGNVLKFETNDLILITIFCSTRTVQTVYEIPENVLLSSRANPSPNNNVIYNCYRHCSNRQLTKIFRLTASTIVSPEIIKSIESYGKYGTEDDAVEDEIVASDDDEEKKDDEYETIIDKYHCPPLKQTENTKSTKSPVSQNIFRQSMYYGMQRRASRREEQLRTELLHCEMDILKLYTKRQHLWDAIQSYEEQR